ncbi:MULTISPECIES: hypothetical protein [Kitasatospora]|uniref:Uncharacterized protein n=1 Tax=Kitasatospora setae (strain ATCC 33774 / DSM 43861 / JCM 3304 / KCC A-0304 / NBRC 14216 / KM-6054) TaxID=452652 RepID=E4NEL5_KITSK|nr:MULTISPECIES: hypothetical protein [Kitasatospora]BAJ29801.1 hypothetical protein KSE_40070 [Kitasatospora setae KM-6054]
MLAVLWPPCTCSAGVCGRRIPVFRWEDGEEPTADDMEELANDIADHLLPGGV